MKIKNPQANDTMDWVHQVILNMLVNKNLDKKVVCYIYPWGETLESIVCIIRASYYRNIQDATVKSVFGRDMIFNLTSVVDWQVITDGKKQQVEIDNVW